MRGQIQEYESEGQIQEYESEGDNFITQTLQVLFKEHRGNVPLKERWLKTRTTRKQQ